MGCLQSGRCVWYGITQSVYKGSAGTDCGVHQRTGFYASSHERDSLDILESTRLVSSNAFVLFLGAPFILDMTSHYFVRLIPGNPI